MGVVLVTGCGSGFGLLAAVEAAKRGHTVYAGLRRLEAKDALVAAAEGLDVKPIQLDVTVPEQRDAAVARVLEEAGRIDGLVNNAGVALGGFLETLEEDELRHLFDVNVLAPWALTRAFLPTMRAQGSGTVVMVSSMSGRMAVPGLAAYASSKFALEGLSEGWRHELAPFGIRVVVVEPGPYKTDILTRNRTLGRNAADPDSPYAAWMKRLDGVMEARMASMAGDPQDVADRICTALDARAPAFRHPMGKGSRLRDLMVRLAPFAVIERVVARVAGPGDTLST